MISIFGATGQTGSAILKLALDNGHKVKVHCRNAALISVVNENLIVVKDNPAEDSLSNVIEGTDEVILAFGARAPYTDIFCAELTSRIIDKMKEFGVERLICQTGAMVGDDTAHLTFPFRWMRKMAIRKMSDLFEDKKRQEQVVMESGSSWTIVKPSRIIRAGKQNYNCGPDIRIGLMSRVSTGDLADFVLNNAEDFIHQKVYIKR